MQRPGLEEHGGESREPMRHKSRGIKKASKWKILEQTLGLEIRGLLNLKSYLWLDHSRGWRICYRHLSLF